jgi:alkanesulfonate monooxygenase SsuD/methylene tetrahydromethanopterin reductase-like flavin-dependent oxidoreductase (luciferase family)
LRLGIGVGWNAVEYEALNEDFSTRGARSVEQIELLRRLWTEQSVTFDGTFHTVTGAGLSPLPVQRPIPIWIGTASAPGYRRAGRIADGWFPMVGPGGELDEARAIVDRAAVDAGRDPASIGMEGRVTWSGDDDAVAAELASWARAGASLLSVNTMGAGLATVDDHLEVLARIADAVPAEHHREH